VNLLVLLLAKTGAATLTTKVVVVGAVSAAALGTAGVTGVVPVEALLPGDSTAVVVEEDSAADEPAEEITTDTGDADAVEVSDPATEDVVEEDATEDDATPEDGGSSAAEALEAVRSKAPEQAQPGLERAQAAVARAAERRADASADASEEATQPTGPTAPEAGSDPQLRSGAAGAGNGAGRN
jgi:hypothetical protein